MQAGLEEQSGSGGGGLGDPDCVGFKAASPGSCMTTHPPEAGARPRASGRPGWAVVVPVTRSIPLPFRSDTVYARGHCGVGPCSLSSPTVRFPIAKIATV